MLAHLERLVTARAVARGEAEKNSACDDPRQRRLAGWRVSRSRPAAFGAPDADDSVRSAPADRPRSSGSAAATATGSTPEPHPGTPYCSSETADGAVGTAAGNPSEDTDDVARGLGGLAPLDGSADASHPEPGPRELSSPCRVKPRRGASTSLRGEFTPPPTNASSIAQPAGFPLPTTLFDEERILGGSDTSWGRAASRTTTATQPAGNGAGRSECDHHDGGWASSGERRWVNSRER